MNDRFSEMRGLSSQEGYPAQPVIKGLFNCSNLIGSTRQDETANLTQICITPTDTTEMYENTNSPFFILDLTHMNLNNNSSMTRMFSGSNFTEIILNNKTVDVPTSMAQMFRNCTNLTTVDMSNFVTNQTNALDSIFLGCSNLKTLNLNNFTSLETSYISKAFSGCQNLEGELDLRGIKINSNMTKISLSDIFADCHKITKVLFRENWHEGKPISSLKNFCKNCYNLEYIDLIGMNTLETTDIESMFCGCRNLEFNLDYFNFARVKNSNFTNTFYDCQKLQQIEFQALYTSTILNMDMMFKNCYNLKSIKGGSFDNPSDSTKLRSMKEMFANCYSLETFNPDSFYINRAVDYTGLFYNCMKLKNLYFSDSLDGTSTQYGNIYKEMFYNCKELESIGGFQFVGNSPSDTSYMFYNCEKLREAPVEFFKIVNASNMDYMFYNCKRLTSIPIGLKAPARTYSKYNGSMISMFENCENLQEMDLRHMKFYCDEPESLFGELKVDKMFSGCKSLRKLDLRGCTITINAEVIDFLKDVPIDCEIWIDNYSTKYWMQQHYPEHTNIIYSGT